MDVVTVVEMHDFSMFALFMQADWVVKSVMVGLLIASVWCWAIIANRLIAYGRAKRDMRAFEKAFASGKPLSQLQQEMRQEMGQENQHAGLSAVFLAAMEEWDKSHQQQAANAPGLQSRLEIALDLAVSEQSTALEKRLGFLATIGSAGPFVGLFGTVWGIMNAFTAIAAAENTSLAVVAPGIAEALLATALGLLAAIPAVIAYNKLSADAGHLIAKLEGFADRLVALLSRQLDAGKPL
ncbi:biopolymer transporter ExbB [Devosia limi DSM 17137]|uniref:Tol-Pal system protein TolQ n=1 Tax=Devosia limi DSM 17137 TaxID=1121477 RepID=A0A0F5LRJ6_9HYPH|nr:protein TolQ [Devosia limi]KKB84990.1 biopolymer transporter ExbB [Devosia limi DSM 17137]SHF02362.1 Cell division and transport-associated protein TolQ (TC 2.C.1.2.1) [Devosia limi DSM 17137]